MNNLEYEILSYYFKSNPSEIYPADFPKKKVCRISCYYDMNGDVKIGYDMNDYPVYSLKRLSDGKIFKVGDTVQSNEFREGQIGEIIEFDFERVPFDEGVICFINDLCLGQHWKFNQISHIN